MNADAGLTLALVSLLKGIVERDQNAEGWQAIIDHRNAVGDYLAVLNLRLHLDDNDGYAFVRQVTDESDEPTPQLVVRRPLSYRASLLLVLMRKRLLEHDARSGEPRLIIGFDDIVELMRIYLTESADETRLNRGVETAVNKAVELGLLGRLPKSPGNFEVKRAIKAIIDADFVSDYLEQMKRSNLAPEARAADT